MTRFSAFCGAMLLFSLVSPAGSQEVIFLGSWYERSNGDPARSSTVVTEHQFTPSGARAQVFHNAEQASFSANFWVDCSLTEVRFAADVGLPHVSGTEVVITVFPEWALVEFSDGRSGALPEAVDWGGSGTWESAVEIAGASFRRYLAAGEPNEPIETMIEALTNQIIALHGDMLPFLSAALLARTCAAGS